MQSNIEKELLVSLNLPPNLLKHFGMYIKVILYEKYQSFILYLLVDVNGSKVIVLNMPWHPFIQDVI